MNHYPLPYKTAVKILVAFLLNKQRSFRKDSIQEMKSIERYFIVEGNEYIPARGPCLVTMNHFHQRGFTAWWIGFAISAVLPDEVHWLMTSAWLFEGKLWGKTREKITRVVIRIITGIYGFTTTPPMPPNPAETKEGAASIRKLLKFAENHPQAFIGLTPEGRDSLTEGLTSPPAGTGRLIGHLAKRGYRILPSAIYEANSCLILRFGSPYDLDIPMKVSPQERDDKISQQVMDKITALLPAEFSS
jgi:hypothetical protein